MEASAPPTRSPNREPRTSHRAQRSGWVTFAGAMMLILGLVIALTGLGLLAGNELARVMGVVLLGFNAVLQVAWFPAAPLWAIMIIALDIVIIYQLISDWVEHGSSSGSERRAS